MNEIVAENTVNEEILYSNLLTKVTKIKYAEDIRSGKLYMNKLSYFRKLEHTGVGDEREGFLCESASGYIMLNGEIVGECSNITTFLDFPIFCATAVSFTKTDYNRGKFVVSKQLLKEFMYDENEQYVLLIINGEEFQKKVRDALAKARLNGFWGYVEYTNSKKLPASDELYQIAFRKRTTYSYQQEWRLVIDAHADDHFEFDIGDISDISWIIPIDNSDKELTIEVKMDEDDERQRD